MKPTPAMIPTSRRHNSRRANSRAHTWAKSQATALAFILAVVALTYFPLNAEARSLKLKPNTKRNSTAADDKANDKANGNGGVTSTGGMGKSGPESDAPIHHPDNYFSWQRCIDTVNKNNADLVTGAENVKASEQTLRATYMDYLPSFEAEYNLGRQTAAGVDTDGSNAVVQGSETFFNGFKTVYTVKQNEAALRTAKAQLQTTRAAVSAELITAYEGFLYAKAFKKLTESIIERREENLRLVTLRYESGGENKGSVLLSSANLEQARFDDLQAANAATVAQRQLSKVMGLDDRTPLDIEDPVPIRDPESAPDIQTMAIETPDYEAATASVDNARAAIDITRSTFFPALSFNAGLGKNGNDGIPMDNNTSFFGIQAKIDWFSPFGTYFKQQSASATYRAAESTRISTSRLLLVKIETAFQVYIEGVARFKVAAAFRDAADVRAEIARAKYKNGLITFDDWYIIENDLIDREKNFVSNERDRINAESSWNQAQGKGVL